MCLIILLLLSFSVSYLTNRFSTRVAAADAKFMCFFNFQLQMARSFRNPVAIFASSENQELECLRARLTSINEEARTATYVWMLKGERGSERKPVRYDISTGNEPNQVHFTQKGSPEVYTATIAYTDYKDCFVVKFGGSFYGGQCMMWVRKEVEDYVPQTCIDQFEDICDRDVSLYNHDLCQDDDDEYEEADVEKPETTFRSKSAKSTVNIL
uniref:Lipocalin/cytosolic fatty-acid binding domain-containing protein n=1 Tax=Amblyomma maculatum TaxID=34609 RepID=G3MQY2_AMBMU